ncbi:MAG: hypothetical protein PHI67_07100 [Candidatus Methanomethylophilaceae archaeon]|jgi:hypothetical protein|nr:hypothetical protein [Candidatus Methanomethylophilaceae archaeon]
MTDTPDTKTNDVTPRQEAFAEAAEALQTMATGSMALLSAVFNLLEVASKTSATVDTGTKADPTPEPTPDAPTPTSKAETQAQQTPTPTITPDDITKACVALIKHDRANSQRIQALLQTYGVSQMSALDPSKYEAFMKDLDALGS